MLRKSLLLLLTDCSFQLLSAQDNSLKRFPKGSTPKEIGKQLAYHFINGRHELYDRSIHYAEVCTWNGALDYALQVNDKKLLKHSEDKFEPLFTTGNALLHPMDRVDYNIFGSLALKL